MIETEGQLRMKSDSSEKSNEAPQSVGLTTGTRRKVSKGAESPPAGSLDHEKRLPGTNALLQLGEASSHQAALMPKNSPAHSFHDMKIDSKEGASETSSTAKMPPKVERVLSYQSLEGVLKAAELAEQPSTKTGVTSESGSSHGDSSKRSPPAVITVGRGTSKKSTAKLRRGKWTVEEESYVARVIQDFNSGYLDAPAGTTLRTYLSEKLQCDPMRITKKFTGDACIGKRVFHPAVRTATNAEAIDTAQAELEVLERRWRRRLEMQQKESTKKVVAVASTPSVGRLAPNHSASGERTSSTENPVTRTASWLDRAKSVLREPKEKIASSESRSSSNYDETQLVSQMHEVERLIDEGPVIQKSSAGIPQLLDQAEERSPESPNREPVDKRPRTVPEDAEALVGFLRSVHAAASNEKF